ncbi:IS1595 family transposase, partial [Phocaeicola dorei]|uniref:IS1595 family transposase n=2 Tax=Bacteroidaceae TaxID=815 RepID=UPI0034A14C48
LRELTKRQNESSPEDFAAVIWGCEIDESYIGGKNKNRHKNKKVEKCQGRSYKDKVPVFGILQRNGKLIAKVVERTDMEHLLPIIKKYIKKGSVIYTDGLEYSGITDDYIIRSVNHSARLYGYFEFDETDAMIMVCNNGIENAWSHLKRTIFGTYYHVSRKYMQKYVDEYIFRFNTRKLSDSDRFHLYLQYIYAA